MTVHTTGRRLLAAAVAFALLASLVTACASSSEEASTDSGTIAISPTNPMGEVAPDNTAGDAGSVEGEKSVSTPISETDRLVVLTHTLQLEVESTSETVDAIRALTSAAGGTITDLQVATDAEESFYRYDESGYVLGSGTALRGWMTVRVPADTVGSFADSVRALGTVKYESEGSEDVTQQHVDLNAQLENLKAEEVRLRTFFDSAKTVSDMLAIETELSRVRGEIESLDAQIKYLERQSALATVTIELTEAQPVVRPQGDTWGFGDAITSGFQGAADVLNFVITVLIAASPLWIPALVIFLIVYLVHRAHKNRRAARAVGTSTPPSGGAETGA